MSLMQTADLVQESRDALAKMAALSAAAALPEADPAPTVGYHSDGKVLVIGGADEVFAWADKLAGKLSVQVLLTSDGAMPVDGRYPIFGGRDVHIGGWLGAFEVHWDGAAARQFDLILDLSSAPLMPMHQPPHGYFAPGSDDAARHAAVEQMTQLVGEFEKPRYFRYKERLCAHSRNRKVGCTACIEVCSAKAIESAGDRIKVNAYLCAGCGACTTVCPSGALGYAYPGAVYTGSRLQAALAAYGAAGGAAPVILFHSGGQGAALLAQLEAHLPARVIPMQLHHTASTGIDVWLAALAYGASGLMILTTGEEAPQYAAALTQQMAIAQTVMAGLGYEGEHFQLVEAQDAGQLDAALRRAPRGAAPRQAAAFHVAADKRNTLDLALGHLYRHAPLRPLQVALPVGSPFGALAVDSKTCSLCMACVGACPESALMDGANAPQLRFVEKNCVQCGLCAVTCPENAITLVPRIGFNESWNKAVVLNESQPFCCIRCSKPFGTLQMIENMLGKLSQHSAFKDNLDRIRMCGDCRVIDMMQSQRDVASVERKRS